MVVWLHMMRMMIRGKRKSKNENKSWFLFSVSDTLVKITLLFSLSVCMDAKFPLKDRQIGLIFSNINREVEVVFFFFYSFLFCLLYNSIYAVGSIYVYYICGV